jgi:hypothetical protein
MADAVPAAPPELAPAVPETRSGCGRFALLGLIPLFFLAIQLARAGVDLALHAPGAAGAGIVFTLPALVLLAMIVRALRRSPRLIPGLSDGASLFLAGAGVLVLAVGLPGLYATSKRAPQKATRATMEALAGEIENQRSGAGCYPASLDALPPTAARTDGWGRALRYHPLAQPGSACATGYLLVSPGEDGRFQCEDPARYLQRDTWHYESDLVLRDGEWWAAPAGGQRIGADDQPACETR